MVDISLHLKGFSTLPPAHFLFFICITNVMFVSCGQSKIDLRKEGRRSKPRTCFNVCGLFHLPNPPPPPPTVMYRGTAPWRDCSPQRDCYAHGGGGGAGSPKMKVWGGGSKNNR